MTKICRYCNVPMDAVDVTGFTNPTYKDGRKSIPAYHCTNPACDMKPYLFRYEKINPCDPKLATGQTCTTHSASGEKLRLFRKWYCPFCDNPVEIIDQVYYLWNCPNCHELSGHGVTFRYFPILAESGEEITIDEGAEIVDKRVCGTCWDPFAPEKSEEEEY